MGMGDGGQERGCRSARRLLLPDGPATPGVRARPGGNYAPSRARLEPGDGGEHGRHDQQRDAQPDEDSVYSHGPSIATGCGDFCRRQQQARGPEPRAKRDPGPDAGADGRRRRGETNARDPRPRSSKPSTAGSARTSAPDPKAGARTRRRARPRRLRVNRSRAKNRPRAEIHSPGGGLPSPNLWHRGVGERRCPERGPLTRRAREGGAALRGIATALIAGRRFAAEGEGEGLPAP